MVICRCGSGFFNLIVIFEVEFKRFIGSYGGVFEYELRRVGVYFILINN